MPRVMWWVWRREVGDGFGCCGSGGGEAGGEAGGAAEFGVVEIGVETDVETGVEIDIEVGLVVLAWWSVSGFGLTFSGFGDSII